MRILAFSDLHLDTAVAEAVTRAAQAADLVIGAGDFATAREGLPVIMDYLSCLDDKAIWIPGNNESADELRAATRATVLHGEAVERDGFRIAGLGGGVPPLPDPDWDSWDLSEDEAREHLAGFSDVDVLVTHSPPHGLGDGHDDAGHLGSRAIRDAVERLEPRLSLFGHVHDCWCETGCLGPTRWRNLGPTLAWFEL